MSGNAPAAFHGGGSGTPVFITIIGNGPPTAITPAAEEALVQLGWQRPDPIASGDYKPGCSREDCVCHTPPRVCPEFLEDWQDEHCVRCGWSKPAHAVAS